VEPKDYVEVECLHETVQGVLLPSNQKDFTVIKLSNGYNIGIHKRNIKNIAVIEQKKEHKEKPEKVSQNEKLPKVTILHTGGTIASKVDYTTGAVHPQFTPEELLGLFPELKELANLNSRLVANLFSENMRFDHYNVLAKEIEKEINAGARGIIITHGTDTLHYTAAALSFVLENIPVPVVLVGAQRSSDRGSSDAAMNLISAVAFAVNSKFSGVAVCMHENDDDTNCVVIDGLHARKLHTSKRSAFVSVNRPLLAKVNYETKSISHISMPEQTSGTFALKLFDPKIKIGWIKSHPHFSEDEIVKDVDGLILEGTGLGHFPIEQVDALTKEHVKIKKKLTELAKKIPVVMTSQCIFGRVNMNVYSLGRTEQEMGILGNGLDMPPETVFIKLAWLLSNFKKDIPALLARNFRGELSERTEQDTSY